MASLVRREDTDVMYVLAAGGAEGSSQAFDELESRLPSLRGRKFFATVHAGEYRACVAIKEGDDPKAMDLSTGAIPGGAYARQRLEGGFGNIAPTFDAMAAEHTRDPDRPVIEFYRRHDDVILFMPVTG